MFESQLGSTSGTDVSGSSLVQNSMEVYVLLLGTAKHIMGILGADFSIVRGEKPPETKRNKTKKLTEHTRKCKISK